MEWTCYQLNFMTSDQQLIVSFHPLMLEIVQLLIVSGRLWRIFIPSLTLEFFRFGYLSKLAQTLLVLPHSNADPKRLVSMVRKIETEERTQLDPSILSDLLSVKLNKDEPCYMSQHLVKNNNNMLSVARSATTTSLKK